jgi:perosamine synthetase
LTLGQEYGIFIIEDAAQAFGARIEGKMVGSLGDAGFYSLGRGKCIPTGHGGVIVAQEKLSSVISETIRANLPLTIRREVSSLIAFLAYGVLTRPEGWLFVTRSPLNPASAGMDIAKLPSIRLNRMSATQAGLGISILDRLEKVQAIGKQNASLLMKRLADFEFISCFKGQPAAEPVFLRLPILVEGEARANKLFERLNQAGIGVSRSYYRILPDLFPELPTRGDGFPGAERLANCLLTLPTHSYMNDIDFDRITMIFLTIDH